MTTSTTDWEAQFEEKFPPLTYFDGTKSFGNHEDAANEVKSFIRDLLAAARLEQENIDAEKASILLAAAKADADKLVEGIHLYNTDAVKALASARQEGRDEAVEYIKKNCEVTEIDESATTMDGVSISALAVERSDSELFGTSTRR